MRGRNRSGTKKEKLDVIFAGRSNVGKSSTIRALTGIRVLVGKRPGSTRWEKLFDLGSVNFVDFPGFGFMVGKTQDTIEEMKVRIIQVLEEKSNQLALAILLIDLSLFRELVERYEKRNEIPIDIEFYTFLSEIAPKVIVVANKIDKLKKRELVTETDYLEFKLREALPSKNPTIAFISAKKRIGIIQLKQLIESSLAAKGIEKPQW